MTRHDTTTTEDDIEALADAVGVLRRVCLCFVATCAAGCGTVVPSDQVMCSDCARK